MASFHKKKLFFQTDWLLQKLQQKIALTSLLMKLYYAKHWTCMKTTYSQFHSGNRGSSRSTGRSFVDLFSSPTITVITLSCYYDIKTTCTLLLHSSTIKDMKQIQVLTWHYSNIQNVKRILNGNVSVWF